jgi:hypothetical protein
MVMGEPDQGDRQELTAAIDRLDRSLDRFQSSAGNRNTTNVRLEGSGTMWGALSVGVALGAAVACTAWVSFTLSNVMETQRNNEAFIQATYQQAPEIRARFDKIKEEQESP